MSNKKKIFPKSTLPRRSTPPDSERQSLAAPVVSEDTKVYFPTDKHAKGRRSFDFGPWYGQGFDAVTAACHQQIERLLSSHDGNLSPASVVTYCSVGLTNFFDFLCMWHVALERQVTLADIDRNLIEAFLAYLKDRNLQTSSQSSIYSNAKSVLVAMGKRKVLQIVDKGDEATFPANPHPGMRRGTKGQPPLPRQQRLAFTAAVKTEVMALFREDAILTSELLAYALLVIALHTGRNTVPLLELTTTCLRSHPKRGVKFLVVYKRRGNKASGVAVRAEAHEGTVESTPAVLATVVRLVHRVMELTSDIRQEAPQHLSSRLWLYPSRQGQNMGAIVALSQSTLELAASKLVEKHGLVEPDGQPVRINCSRLRKTFINRINEILDNDVVTTAAAAGNTPQVTGTTYLRPGEDSKKNWRFMGIMMADELRSGTVGNSEKTPVARCTDIRKGQFAPKKEGALCMSFLDCLRCRNCVVTGEDLHKVFSLYWRVYRERGRMDPRKWQRRLAHIPRVIDRDVVAEGVKRKMFTQAHADACREHAKVSPHPFWTDDGVLEALQ